MIAYMYKHAEIMLPPLRLEPKPYIATETFVFLMWYYQEDIYQGTGDTPSPCSLDSKDTQFQDWYRPWRKIGESCHSTQT